LRGDVNGDMQNEEKVTIIDSPEPNSSISSISSIPSLPPLLKSLKLNVLK
jgi:hypothetical protein